MKTSIYSILFVLIAGLFQSFSVSAQSNDNCIDAIAISCGETLFGSNDGATVGDELLAIECVVSLEGPGVWYLYSSTGPEEVTFSTCGSAFDTKINVYSGSCGAFICAGGNDDDCGSQSSVTIITSASATDYLIHISGWNGATGDFDLAVTCELPSCIPPANDMCSFATQIIDAIPYLADNACAQPNDVNPACSGFGDVDGVWYTWNSGGYSACVLDFSPASITSPGDSAAVNPSVAIYSGGCNNPVEITCFNGDVNEVITDLIPNTEYYFLIFTDDDDEQGQFDLQITGGNSGCTIYGACNFDSQANIDDESCDISCLGCTNINSLNYDGPAIEDGGILTDDGSCVVVPCGYSCPERNSFCYNNNSNEIYNFYENTPGAGIALEIVSGFIEVGWDEILIYDDINAQGNILNEVVDGDLSGLLFSSAGNMSIQILSDVSTSCSSEGWEELEVEIYCGFYGSYYPYCFSLWSNNYDPSLPDCSGVLGGSDSNCCLGIDYEGCADPDALNYADYPVMDNGTCCYENFVEIELENIGNQGAAEFNIFDESMSLVGISEIEYRCNKTGSICLEPQCYTITFEMGSNPESFGLKIKVNDEVIINHEAGTLHQDLEFTLDIGGGCASAGCMDEAALNFNLEASLDCNGVSGGGDVGCCIYGPINPGDYNNDLQVNVSDLGGFLGDFGSESVYGDFDGDGFASVADLGGFLGIFGTSY